jgi:hypothetical protein
MVWGIEGIHYTYSQEYSQRLVRRLLYLVALSVCDLARDSAQCVGCAGILEVELGFMAFNLVLKGMDGWGGARERETILILKCTCKYPQHLLLYIYFFNLYLTGQVSYKSVKKNSRPRNSGLTALFRGRTTYFDLVSSRIRSCNLSVTSPTL